MSDSWIIEQTDFESAKTVRHMESLFTLGNGYLGIRGDSILSDWAFERGTYINGFYESGPIKYGEKAFGYAENWQTIIPLPEGKEISISINGREILTDKGVFRKQKRIQNLKESYNLWTFIWVDEDGLEYEGSVKSLVPFELQGAAIFIWNLTLPEEESTISFKSSLIYENNTESEIKIHKIPIVKYIAATNQAPLFI